MASSSSNNRAKVIGGGTLGIMILAGVYFAGRASAPKKEDPIPPSPAAQTLMAAADEAQQHCPVSQPAAAVPCIPQEAKPVTKRSNTVVTPKKLKKGNKNPDTTQKIAAKHVDETPRSLPPDLSLLVATISPPPDSHPVPSTAAPPKPPAGRAGLAGNGNVQNFEAPPPPPPMYPPGMVMQPVAAGIGACDPEFIDLRRQTIVIGQFDELCTYGGGRWFEPRLGWRNEHREHHEGWGWLQGDHRKHDGDDRKGGDRDGHGGNDPKGWGNRPPQVSGGLMPPNKFPTVQPRPHPPSAILQHHPDRWNQVVGPYKGRQGTITINKGQYYGTRGAASRPSGIGSGVKSSGPAYNHGGGRSSGGGGGSHHGK